MREGISGELRPQVVAGVHHTQGLEQSVQRDEAGRLIRQAIGEIPRKRPGIGTAVGWPIWRGAIPPRLAGPSE